MRLATDHEVVPFKGGQATDFSGFLLCAFQSKALVNPDYSQPWKDGLRFIPKGYSGHKSYMKDLERLFVNKETDATVRVYTGDQGAKVALQVYQDALEAVRSDNDNTKAIETALRFTQSQQMAAMVSALNNRR